MTDFTKCTATELADLYRTGSASPVTVAEQVLAKIERLNPVLNAFCFTDPATTLAQAGASEHRWQQAQQLSDLDGVPVAVKDSILTQGWPTLKGSRTIDPAQPWLEDAPAVARLREAGVVFVGKTTMSEFGLSSYDSDSVLYGQVHNPWNFTHSPGGSSGGSAVAVAAGLVPVALGTDLGGSIAVPSAFCGAFGMKPSIGRVPQWPVDVFESAVVGPLARSVDDIALTMNIITKPDVRDGISLPYSNIDYRVDKKILLSGKKIACIKHISGFDIDHNIAQSLDKAIEYLVQQGAHVDFINLDIDLAIKTFHKFLQPKALQQWLNIPAAQRHLAGRNAQQAALLAHIPESTHAQLINRHKLITQMRKVMQSYEILLGPVTTIDSIRQPASVKKISPLSIFFCMTKQPTITVPIGLDQNGMPMSIAIAGAMHDDVCVLQMAQVLESAFPMPHPPLFYSKGPLCKNEILKNA